jgi:hypothetical protein
MNFRVNIRTYDPFSDIMLKLNFFRINNNFMETQPISPLYMNV